MKRAIAIAVSLLILGAIYYKIDIRGLGQSFRQMDFGLFGWAMALFLPQFVISARRWQRIVEDHSSIDLWHSAWLGLAGNTLNIVLPSKLGDFAKAFYHHRHNGVDYKKGVSLTVIEKAFDFAGLSVVLITGALLMDELDATVSGAVVLSSGFILLAIGLFFLDPKRLKIDLLFEKVGLGKRAIPFIENWQAAIKSQKRRPARLVEIASLTILLWYLHLAQIYLFFLSLGSTAPVPAILALVPVSILVGLIPISFGGIGPRDAALIYLFAPYSPAPLMAGVGILCNLRYFVPALFGLPFVSRLGLKPSEISKQGQANPS